MIQNYLPLIEGVVNAFLFLESAGPNEVDPDSAVRCMEDIAASLLTLDKPDQLALRADLEKMADKEQSVANSTFIRALADKIGLASLEQQH